MRYSEHIQKWYLSDLQNAEVSSFYNFAIRTGNAFSVWQAACQAPLMFPIFHKFCYGQTDKEPGLCRGPDGMKQRLAFILPFTFISQPSEV